MAKGQHDCTNTLNCDIRRKHPVRSLKSDFHPVFNEATFETSLAYLENILEEPNDVNLQMQGKKTTIIKHCA